MSKFYTAKSNIFFRKCFIAAALVMMASQPFAQTSAPNYPVRRQESSESWLSDGRAAIKRAKDLKPIKRKAKNVILFVGDGMGVSTLSAARILEGQMRGESCEENRLSFENFSYSALSKTYSANQQTADSAPTMTAMIAGVKTNEGVLSVNQSVSRSDYRTVKGNETETLIETAEKAGKSTGIVSTARLTHATPAACYAHSPDRDWESDKDIFDRSKDAANAKFPDIARQLIEFNYGDGLEVALGWGRTKFLPKQMLDPEYLDKTGERADGRNLPNEWTAKYKNSAYVWNKQEFDRIDTKKTKHLLGLFEHSHMQYEYDRSKDKGGEPSLSEMTTKAIEILGNNKKGYFLMVEAGRIDHAHHDGNAFRALTDTVELSNAVRAALTKINLNETLVIVTADHSHTFTISGYPARGNNIMGLVREVDDQGIIEEKPQGDKNNLPYSTLGYANGSGARNEPRKRLTQEEVLDPNYLQEATVPLSSETHGGEDVAIYADDAGAYLVRGSMEQNWIYQVMKEAMRLN
jgi:alkaline phosphatase